MTSKTSDMWILLPLAVVILTAGTSAKIVNTVYGPVDGNTVTLDDGTIINSWYGIPFAAPPIGNLRFEVYIKNMPSGHWNNDTYAW